MTIKDAEAHNYDWLAQAVSPLKIPILFGDCAEDG